MNAVDPKKLMRSKWTAVLPRERQKHFIVTKVLPPELPGGAVTWVEIEAIHSGAVARIAWRELRDPARWRQGWHRDSRLPEEVAAAGAGRAGKGRA